MRLLTMSALYDFGVYNLPHVATASQKIYVEQTSPSPDNSQVIQSSFSPLIPTSSSLPTKLVPDLLSRFSSAIGYRLYPDVPPFFKSVREARARSRHDSSIPEVVVGIITNSDDRVLPILSSLQISVTARRYDANAKASLPVWQSRGNSDVQFVVLSYDVGFEKPDRRIFDAAKALLPVESDVEYEYVHCGDDVEKDARGAMAAGWGGILLDRENEHKDEGLPRIRSLIELGDLLLSHRAHGKRLLDSLP